MTPMQKANVRNQKIYLFADWQTEPKTEENVSTNYLDPFVKNPPNSSYDTYKCQFVLVTKRHFVIIYIDFKVPKSRAQESEFSRQSAIPEPDNKSLVSEK